MNFLLIDFGASHLKSIVWNKESDSFNDLKVVPSPLAEKNKLPKLEILQAIQSTLTQHESIDAVVMCSILGGYYVSNTYYSWKYSGKPEKPQTESCLLSELFKSQPTYHIHAHHSKKSKITGLQILGTLDHIPFYSSLGDTDCVIESVNLKENELMINLGTGSQVIKRNRDGSYHLASFIPSGRALNAFTVFFGTLNVDLFQEFSQLTLGDLENSTLTFDLNIFPQAHKYQDGGSIRNIQETNFSKSNFIASLFRSYLDQYLEIIKINKVSIIFLAGGISKKYPLIENFIYKKTGIKTRTTFFQYEDTHIGMSNLIKRYLSDKNQN